MLDCGMKLAIEPRAGFYTLWEQADQGLWPGDRWSRRVQFHDDRKTGVVGVHRQLPLYAVCADVDAMRADLAAFKSAEVAYD